MSGGDLLHSEILPNWGWSASWQSPSKYICINKCSPIGRWLELHSGVPSYNLLPLSHLSQIQNLFKAMGVFSINFNSSWAGSRELSDPGDVFWVPADALQGGIFNSFGVFFRQFWSKRSLVYIFRNLYCTNVLFLLKWEEILPFIGIYTYDCHLLYPRNFTSSGNCSDCQTGSFSAKQARLKIST